MRKIIISTVVVFLCVFTSAAQSFDFSGKIMDKSTGAPVGFATLALPGCELWAVANERGEFVVKNVPKGKLDVEISCLGYVDAKFYVDIEGDLKDRTFYLNPDNLTLASATVTAQENTSSTTTTRTIDRVAIDHMQMTDVSKLSALLPGGVTSASNNLTSTSESASRFSIRSGVMTSELGNSSFSTAVEVDGVRLSNNSNFLKTAGVSTKNIASANVESIEIITGVPSVEYGDMSSGIVKVNTKKGTSPFVFTVSTDPNTKQFSLGKGFDLGGKRGILNFSAERTKANSDIASPYTTYQRNNVSLIYSNTFYGRNGTSEPVRFTAGITGNIGGYDSEADPDAFKETYTKIKDNTLRGNVDVNWLLNRPWITSVEFSASAVFSDDDESINTNKSSASSSSALHGKEEGYYVSTAYDVNPNAEIILRPAGYWYELERIDSRPLDYSAKLKANLAKTFGNVNNRFKAGLEFTGSGNLGKGINYDDLGTAPTWRTYPYDEIPFMNNLAAYAEDNVIIPAGSGFLDLKAGIRSEWTFVSNSSYGTVNSLSPRFNAKYTALTYDKDRFVRALSFRASWGVAVKLPSFNILYPTPSYKDILTFAPGALADGSAYYAYYIQPQTINYNSSLKWQRNHQSEVGLEADLGGTTVSISAYYNRTFDAYVQQQDYTPFSYNFTSQMNLAGCEIPSANRSYLVDRSTGIVTVADVTGKYADYVVDAVTRKTFSSSVTTTNETVPYIRKGIEWVVDFGMIRPIMTSIRLDGSYYSYSGHSEVIQAGYLSTTMSDGSPYKYVGYYAGAQSGASNGSAIEKLQTNVTFTTHIPSVRMILSLRIEGSLYTSQQYVSEYSGSKITYEVDGSDYTPLDGDYTTDRNYAATYPLYYVSVDDPTDKIAFLGDGVGSYAWAKENDTTLYNYLTSLIRRSNTNYFFRKNVVSPYLCANISVTKEIGDKASLSFYANNFFRNLSNVTNSWNDTETTLLDLNSYPVFYYGMTLRLKF
ncbi:MAG: TonB-dependent receptor [Bacteroidales bacterium]|jgi:outer membrane receptor protein involved in Fe transport|nr:TonB-dependent receptor [Bacteroidales bacterium]MCI2121540.1 TonB-dependent receptor [Bacteroidales bacterium]MCI2145429.1 TonB-dependent receptor [Bacteroidales bacterium]